MLARTAAERATLRAALSPETRTQAVETEAAPSTDCESQTAPPPTKSRETQADQYQPRLRVPVGTVFPGETTNQPLRRSRRWEPGPGGAL